MASLAPHGSTRPRNGSWRAEGDDARGKGHYVVHGRSAGKAVRCAVVQAAFLAVAGLLGCVSLITLYLASARMRQLSAPAASPHASTVDITGLPGSMVQPVSARVLARVVHSTPWDDVPQACLAWTTAADTVFHITRELHPLASVGGAGRVISGMLQQSESTTFAVLPAYDFLLRHDTGDAPLLCGEFAPAHALPVRVWYLRTPAMRVFLLEAPSSGPDDVWPTLWRVGNASQIYKDQRGFTQNDRDVWFGGAVATFVTTFLHGYLLTHDTDVHGQLLPTSQLPCASWSCITMHVHGSINAPAIWYVRGALPAHRRPTILFTLHSYNGELWRIYSVSALAEGPVRTLARRTCVLHGIPMLSPGELADTTHPAQLLACIPSDRPQQPLAWASSKRANMLYATTIGLRLSDAATTVSSGMLAVIMNMTDVLPDDVSRAFREMHKSGRIVPISNAVSSDEAPFYQLLEARNISSQRLPTQAVAAFRDWPKRAVKFAACRHVHSPAAVVWPAAGNAGLNNVAADIIARKQAAKAALARALFDVHWEAPTRKLAGAPDAEPIVVAAGGPFLRSKGSLVYPKLVQALHRGQVTSRKKRPLFIVIVGQRVDVPTESEGVDEAWDHLRALSMDSHTLGADPRCLLRFISDPDAVAQWMPTIRLAADIVLLPSRREAFGLEVAEALGHAAVPIATAVGGVPDIITPEPRSFRSLMQACFTYELHGGDGCDSSATRLLAAMRWSDQLQQPAWNGYLVPVVSHAPEVVAAAFVTVLRDAVAGVEALNQAAREQQAVTLVASTPGWAASNAAYECLNRAVAYARSQPNPAPVVLAPPPAAAVKRYGPQLLPRLHVAGSMVSKAQQSLVGWTASVRGYVPETLSIGSDTLARIARMSLPRSGEADVAVGEPRRAGLQTDIVFPDGGTRAAVVVSAYSSGLNVELGAPEDYCVYVDAYYNDGTTKYGLISDYGAGSHAWTARTIEVPAPPASVPARTLERLTVAFLLRTGGEVTISEPSVRLQVELPA